MSTSRLFPLRIACAVLLTVFSFSKSADAQNAYPERKLIALQSDSADFRRIVDAIRDPATKIVPDTDVMKSSHIYFRLTNYNYVFDDNKFTDEAWLGGSPYVFLTVPEAGFGRSLYQIYSDLGYDAESVLKQRDQHMVALVLRYITDIQFSETRDGGGPLGHDDFRKYVYVPTWKNGFKLFARLAGEPMPPKSPDPLLYLNFDSDADRTLARFFPAERRHQIAELPYPLLRVAGGPDWDYRQLLQSKMSMNSHFRGVGITENTLSPADNRKGLPEFVGPNGRLKGLHDYAVIDFGKMKFLEVHD